MIKPTLTFGVLADGIATIREHALGVLDHQPGHELANEALAVTDSISALIAALDAEFARADVLACRLVLEDAQARVA